MQASEVQERLKEMQAKEVPKEEEEEEEEQEEEVTAEEKEEGMQASNVPW